MAVTFKKVFVRKKIKKIIILDIKRYQKNLKNFNKIKLIKKDINNLQSIESSFKDIDFVIHLVVLSDVVPSNPKEYLNTNIIETVNVLI